MANSEARLGKISAIDYPAGTVRVVYHEKDDNVTRMIPLLSPIHYGEYSMPEVGDQVLILHLSNGTEAGVVLGRPWSQKFTPAEGFKGLYRKEYCLQKGKAYERYDAEQAEAFSQFVTGTTLIEATKKWTVQVGPCSIVVDAGGTITITAPSGLEVVTPLAHFTGEIRADGDIIAGGEVSLQKHTHKGAVPPNI